MRSSAKNSGFTLIELVIVVLIVGVLAAAAAPKYSESLASARLRAVTHRIAGDIRHARRTAQQNSTAQSITFDVAANCYTLNDVTDINRHSQSYQFFLDQPEYDCELVSASFGGNSVLTMNIHGRPSSNGSIVIRCGGLMQTLTLNEVGIIGFGTIEAANL